MTPRESRLSPQRLAKLANALGVSTPLPVSSHAPSPSISTSNRFLLHVIPPSHLAPNAPGFLRGTLLPLHPTLHAQLAAIAREYALPSTAGLVLYLISESDQPAGPRLSDDIWKVLWSRVVSVERSPSPSPLRPLTCSPSPSTPSSIRSAFKSDSLHSDPATPDTSIDTPPAHPTSRDLLLPGLTSPSLLPILAKVEFDIDKRKATWYSPWFNSRLKKKSNAPRELLTVKRSEMLKKDPLGLNNPPTPINGDEEEDDDEDEELDEDATATFAKHSGTTGDDHQGFSTKEDEVLEMLETMSSKSRSSSTHSSLARKVLLPPLVINPDAHTKDNNRDMEQSYLAYTEPLPSPVQERDESLHIISNREGQGGKREFAVFDDLELELDHTLDIDDDDPNDRRKSQLIMRAKLDEIERTMAQLSPRMLHSDLSLSPDRSSLRVSPTSSKGLEFLSPRTPSDDNSRSFITSSPPRLRRSDEDEIEDKSWPAIPFSMIKGKEQGQPESANSSALPPPPRLALNGVSTVPPRAFVPAPTRPPPPQPPMTGSIISNGMSVLLTETEKRRREVEEEQGVYAVTVGRDLPLDNGGIIPLSPDPFGRFPSSSLNEPPPDITGEVAETRARSGTVTTTKSRFSADSGDGPLSALPAGGGLKPTSNRTTLMSVKTIKKLWRRSKEKEKNFSSGDAPPPTPLTPTFANFASSAGSSNDIDKSLPSIPPPRPSRPSEEQLDFPDISMQAALPPRLTPSPTPRISSRPLVHSVVNGDSAQSNVNGSGRRTPQEQLAVRPPSRPSLDQPTAPSPPPALTHGPPQQQQPGSGRRTPQDQLMFRPPSRPSLDQPAAPPPPALTPPLQQHQQKPLGSGRRTPQDQLPFRPPSRPSLDQQPSVLPAHSHVPPPHPSHFRHPSQPQHHQQPPMQMPMFQGRNPNNGPVTPLLAMHYPSRSSSVSQQQKFDMNRLLFDQESPYPVRLASFAGGGTPAGAGTVPPTTKVAAAAASYVGGASVGANARASPPPQPQPQRPPSAEPEKTTAITTMRKSILKWKLANPNTNGNTNPYGNSNNQGSSDTSSSSSSSSTSSSIVGGAVPRQSFERFERPGTAGSNGGYGHHHARGGGGSGRRPSVINFGSTSSLSSSTSVSSNRGGAEIPRNPQVPAQYTMMRSASGSSSSGGESKPNYTPHVHFKVPTTNPQLNPHPSISTPSPSPINQKPPPSLTIQNPNDLQPTPSPQSLSPSQQSFDSQSPGSAVERRSNASSFDMTQFEFVSPVPASAPVHGSLRT